jgi:hypothetical protein
VDVPLWKFAIELMENRLPGVVVPMPTLLAKYALSVVVAPPKTVSPPACVPAPIVEEANAVRPPLNWVRAVVALPAAWNG